MRRGLTVAGIESVLATLTDTHDATDPRFYHPCLRHNAAGQFGPGGPTPGEGWTPCV